MVEANPGLFSRRDMLRGVFAASAGGALAEIIPRKIMVENPCDLRQNIDSDQVDNWKELTYRDFQVSAVTTQEAYSKRRRFYLPPDPNLDTIVSRDWSVATLKLFYNALSNLPGHFMEPEAGKTFSFGDTIIESVYAALDHLSTSDCECLGQYASGYLPNILREPDVVIIDALAFTPKKNANTDLSMRIVAHEFTHRYDIDVIHGRTWGDLEEVLGGGFLELAPKIREKIERVDPIKLEPTEALAHNRLSYGFAAKHTNFAEVVAVLSELYLYNAVSFTKGLSPFVGHDTAFELYNLMRENIFLEKEYEAFPQIADTCRGAQN